MKLEISNLKTHTTKHSLNSVQIYIDNANSIKVRDLSDLEPVSGVLRYYLVVLGIREQNMPSQAQFSVLVDFVKSQLGKYTIEEFKTAVQMAVAKKLEINANTYQNLTCVFISELMSVYDNHIRRSGFKREEHQNLLLKEKPKQVTDEDREVCNTLFADSVLLKENDFKNSCEKTGVPYFEYISSMYNLFYRDLNFHSKEQIKEIKKLKFAVMIE